MNQTTIGALTLMLTTTTCTQATTIYMHDFEDGTGQGTLVSQVVQKTYVDDGLVPIVGNYFGLLYAGQSYTKVLTDTFEAGFTYELSLDHFAREDQAAGYGGEAIMLEIGYDNGGFTALSSQIFAETGDDPATLLRRAINWATTAGGSEVGQSIVFRITDPIGNNAAHQAGVDNIEVIQWIPELGSYALIVGLLSLTSVMVRRR